MRATTEIAPAWSELMAARGHKSVRALALAAGVSAPTVARLLRGQGISAPATVRRVADALGVTTGKVLDLSGQGGPGEELGPYVPTGESVRLSAKQREAVDAVIRSMVVSG